MPVDKDIVDRMFKLVDTKFKEQKDFAAAIGVDASHISRWRNRKSSSYRKYLPQIASILGTTTEYLLTGEGPKKRGSRPAVSAPAPIDRVEPELREYLDQLRNRDEMRMLFSVTKGATKEQVEAIVKMIESMQDKP